MNFGKLIPFTIGGIPDNLVYYEQLALFVAKIKPRKIMEIGFGKGLGAKALIKEAKKWKKKIEYFGFDTFQGSPESNILIYRDFPFLYGIVKIWTSLRSIFFKNGAFEFVDIDEAKEILKGLNCDFHLFMGDTRKTLPEVVNKLPKMDLIYIDGGHDYETAKSDWENSKKLMHNKTLAVFDDYPLEGVKEVVDGINGYEVKIIKSRFAAVKKLS